MNLLKMMYFLWMMSHKTTSDTKNKNLQDYLDGLLLQFQMRIKSQDRLKRANVRLKTKNSNVA